MSQNCSLNKITHSDMTTEKVCKYHNVGYCKYKEKCMFFHFTEDCEKKCKRSIYALRDTEKPVSMEKIVNIN